MDCALLMLVVAAFGVTYGWQPVDEESGGYEYVVQLEPELVDVLQSGQSVPIESYVPADVGPIRKVRIIVGNDADAASESIVRGQSEDAPQSHTARFANDGWSDDRYQYDAPAPWPTNNQPAAAAWPQSTPAPSRVAQAAGQQPAARWTSIGPDVVPPPLLTPFSPSTTTSGKTNFEPPTQNDRYLATPLEDRYPTNPPGDDWARTATTNSGTALALPDPSPTGRLQLPSPPPLNSPTNIPATRNNAGWDTGWGTNTNSASADADGDLVPVVPLSSRRQDQPQASARQTSSPWADDDRWAWPSDGQPATGQTASAPPRSDWPTPPPLRESPTVPLRSDWPTTTTTASSDGWNDSVSTTPPVRNNLPSTAWPGDSNNPPQQQNAANQPVITTATTVPTQPAITTAAPTLPGQQQPWLPLLLVTLGLAGSIGANLFLGWSYMDARQRYRSLVRKTTDVFQRATGAAA